MPLPPDKVKRLKAVAKFKPPTATKLLRNRALMVSAAHSKKIVELVIKGYTYEQIGRELGVPVHDAFEVCRKSIEKWTKEFGLELTEARELDAKRLDALMVMLWGELEKRPKTDEKGNLLCDPLTGDVVYEPIDKGAVKMVLDVLERRAKLYGLDSAVKLEQKKTIDIIERRYIGVKLEGL